MRQMGATFVELAFFLDESRSIATKDPDVDVRWLLAHNRSDDACEASEFNLDAVVRCFVADDPDGNSVFALRCNDDMDEVRFQAGRNRTGRTFDPARSVRTIVGMKVP